MDLTPQISKLSELLQQGHYKQAVMEAGSLLERVLKQLYSDSLPKLPPKYQTRLTETAERIGKGKPVTDFTLGQLAGLVRDGALIGNASQSLNRDMKHLHKADFNTFIEIRNKATHAGEEVSEDEAQLFVWQVRVFAREAGYLRPVDEKPSSVPSKSEAAAGLKPWIEVVSLHSDVLSDEFSADIFALDLGPLVDGNPNVPSVYRDPEHFFRASYLTSGLKSLLQDVLTRLEGGAGNRVLKLITPFGGGKSHTLAALFHAASRSQALDVIPEGKTLPSGMTSSA